METTTSPQATIVVTELPAERSCKPASPLSRALVFSAGSWTVLLLLELADLDQAVVSGLLLAALIVLAYKLPSSGPRVFVQGWCKCMMVPSMLLLGLVAAGINILPSASYLGLVVSTLVLLTALGVVYACSAVIEQVPLLVSRRLLWLGAGALLGGTAASYLGAATLPAGVTLGCFLGLWAADGPVQRPTESLEVLALLLPWSLFLGLTFQDPLETCVFVLGLGWVLWMAARLVKGLFRRKPRAVP